MACPFILMILSFNNYKILILMKPKLFFSFMVSFQGIVTYLALFIHPSTHFLTQAVLDKHLITFDEFNPSFPDHFKFYFLYEIFSHHLIPNSIVFLRLFCPISVSQSFYLYLLTINSLQSC